MNATVSPPQRALRQLARGAGTTFAAKIANSGTKFVTQVALCWLLGAEGFGLYALCIVLYQIGELFATLGLDSGIVRFVSVYHGSGDHERLKGTLLQSAVLPCLAGLLIGAALFAGSGGVAVRVFAKPEMETALKIVACSLPFGAMMTVIAFATTGFGDTHDLAVIWTLQPFLNLLLASVFCLLGYGLEGAAAGWIGSTILGSIFAIIRIRRTHPTLFRRPIKPILETKQLLSFSLPLAFGNFLWLVLLWTDILLLGYYGSEFDVGLYRAVSQTSLLLTLIIVSLNTIFAPTIADLLHKNDIPQARVLFQVATRWSLTATVPIFGVLVVLRTDLLRIFDHRFGGGATPLLILAVGQLVSAGTGSCGQILAMSGHQYLKLHGDLAMAICNIAMNLILIPIWGVTGAAVATGTSVAIVHVIRLLQVYRVLQLFPYDRRFMKSILAGLMTGLVGWLLRPAFAQTGLMLPLVCLPPTMVGVYLIALFTLGLEPQDQSLIHDAYNALRPRTAKKESVSPQGDLTFLLESFRMMKYWKFKLIVLACVFLSGAFLTGVYVGFDRGIPFVHRVRHWSIGIYSGSSPLALRPPEGVSNPVITAARVTDVQADFVADPFLLEDGGKWYLFFEVLNAVTQQGDIGLAHSDDGLNWHYDKIVLDEPFHLSYPQVFRWGDKIYMIPESYEAASVRLYTATRFPDQWALVSILIRNDFVDTTVFRHNDHWWMFAAPNPHGNDKLELYHADQLTGPWFEHPKSPIIIGDPHHARPAGRVVAVGDKLYRFAQDDKPTYGLNVFAFEITTLTLTDYKERAVGKAIVGGSGSGWNADGMHQIDAHERPDGRWIGAVDGYRLKTLFGLRY